MPEAARQITGPAALTHAVRDKIDARARLVPVDGDNMQPTLRPGDVVAVVPADDYDGEGVYVLDGPAGGTALRRCQITLGGRVRLLHDNPLYRSRDFADTVDRARFREVVLGRVVAACRRMG